WATTHPTLALSVSQAQKAPTATLPIPNCALILPICRWLPTENCKTSFMKRLINLKPGKPAKLLLGLLPFVLILVIYMIASDARLAENPNDKLLPSFAQMGSAMHN